MTPTAKRHCGTVSLSRNSESNFVRMKCFFTPPSAPLHRNARYTRRSHLAAMLGQRAALDLLHSRSIGVGRTGVLCPGKGLWQGPRGVLGGWAVSHGRGTPVGYDSLRLLISCTAEASAPCASASAPRSSTCTVRVGVSLLATGVGENGSSQGHNPALTVLCVPNSLDSGSSRACGS